MPELPEVETVARGLSKVLEGKRIARALVRRPDLRRPFPEGLARHLKGKTILRIDRRAKYVLVHLSADLVLLIHLGMSGRILLGSGAAPKGKHAHFAIETEDRAYACLEDPRRFGCVDLAREDELDHHPLLAGLGPEPFDPALDAKGFHQRLVRKRGPVKVALLDQALIAGVGNIYASESLFRSKILPMRPADSLSPTESRILLANLRAVLSEAIASGGSTLRDHVRPDGELGYFQHRFAVYDKEGEPCPRCRSKAKILRIVQAGRSSFYCQRCQR